MTAGSYVPAIAALGFALRAVPIASAWYAPMAGAGWGIVELSYASVWPGIPYIVLGSAVIETPIAPLGRWIGVHGVSGVLVAFAAALHQGVHQRSVGSPLLAAALVALAIPFASLSSVPAAPATGQLQVAVVQPGVPMRSPLDSSIAHQNFEALEALTRALPRVDLIVWPENSLMSTLEGRPDLVRKVSELSSDLRTPLWIGAHRRVGPALVNSIVLFAPGASPVVIYDKVRLLPLAESVPSWLPPVTWSALGRFVSAEPFASGSMSAHTMPPAAFSICFESAFSGEKHDAKAGLLVNAVNDGWYARSPAPEHLLLLARWRAIESGAPMARAASTGISAFINAEGKVEASLGFGRADSLVGLVAPSSLVTPFESCGYWPMALIAAAGCVAGLRVLPRAGSRGSRR